VDAIVRIAIESTIDSISFSHWSDTPSFNTAWTPRSANYCIEIRNIREVEIVEIQMTIARIADPNTEYLEFLYLIFSVVAPLIVTVVLPTVLVVVGFVICKKRRTGPVD
jgi:hypothetical protein